MRGTITFVVVWRNITSALSPFHQRTEHCRLVDVENCLQAADTRSFFPFQQLKLSIKKKE
eukprot:m.24570 g.24570  ORF g.24570 m.24570 type:complete len:60 (-) comp9118_c4_seq1:18-197(-)